MWDHSTMQVASRNQHAAECGDSLAVSTDGVPTYQNINACPNATTIWKQAQ